MKTGRPPVFDYAAALALLRAGKTPTQVARELGTFRENVSRLAVAHGLYQVTERAPYKGANWRREECVPCGGLGCRVCQWFGHELVEVRR